MTEHIAARIGAAAIEAMLYEVAATPKPGLVDRSNNGAHRDMDYYTFMSSAAALRMSFDEFLTTGRQYSNREVMRLLPELQSCGRRAEQRMFAMTRGINTHKGMIFSLGLLCGAAGWLLPKGAFSIEVLCRTVAAMCTVIYKKAYGNLVKKETLTKGERMYLLYGVAGVRGEAESGFYTVRKLSLPRYRQSRKLGCSINDALVDTLLHLLAETMDTNILGRHDMNTLLAAQKRASEILKAGSIHTVQGRSMILNLDEEFMKEYISPGGSADLVAVTHFLYTLENLF